MIVIVDYGMGNLGSIVNMLKKVGAKAMLSREPKDILCADKLILPGVGAFDTAIRNLKHRGYIEILNEQVIGQKIPILGICLGMQLLTLRSEEGIESGLGWLDAQTIRFRNSEDEPSLRIPHMGWNMINVRRDSQFFPKDNHDNLICQFLISALHVAHYQFMKQKKV